jgi:predicted metal-dependent hydrolase
VSNRAVGTLNLLEQAVPAAVFKAEVDTWARRVGVEPKEIRLRPMKRKWASCSSSGRLTFDTGLLRQPAAFRAEAIVHELLHLKVPNHGRLFRSLLRSHLSDRKAWTQ